MTAARRHKTRSDLLISFGGQVFYKAAAFVTIALLARSLVKEDFGRLMFVLALATIGVHFTELGTRAHLIRSIAPASHQALDRLSEVLSLRVPMLAAFVALMIGGVWLYDATLLPIAVAITAYAAIKELYGSFAAVMVALRRVSATVIAFGSGQLMLLAFVAWSAWQGGRLPVVLIGYVMTSVLMLALILAQMDWTRGRFRPTLAIGRLRRVLAVSLPLFAISLLEFLHLKFDTLMLGTMGTFEMVATYEAGAKCLEASQFLIRPVSLIFFPICAAAAAQGDWTGLRRLAPRVTLAGVGLGLSLTVAMWVVAPWFVPLAFGDEYPDSVAVLRAIYLSVPLLFATTVGLFLATSMHRERWAGLVMLVGLAVNIALNAWWIPTYGPLGAAWATVASQAAIASTMLGMCAVCLRRVGMHPSSGPSVRLETGASELDHSA